jgi:hypothetical protein
VMPVNRRISLFVVTNVYYAIIMIFADNATMHTLKVSIIAIITACNAFLQMEPTVRCCSTYSHAICSLLFV